MSDENIKHLGGKQRGRSSSITDAIKRAKQRIRNAKADDLDEPEGFASGDMKRFLADPEEYESGDEHEREKKE